MDKRQPQALNEQEKQAGDMAAEGHGTRTANGENLDVPPTSMNHSRNLHSDRRNNFCHSISYRIHDGHSRSRVRHGHGDSDDRNTLEHDSVVQDLRARKDAEENVLCPE